jgi:hypothetical protein
MVIEGIADGVDGVGLDAQEVDLTPTYSHIIERVLLFHRDGRLITECTREDFKSKDTEMISGALMAIQGISEDGIISGGELQSVSYGENQVVIASGEYIHLAAIIYGEPDEHLQDGLEAVVSNLEVTYAGVIDDWTGDLAPLMVGCEALIDPLIESTAELSREEVTGGVAGRGVSLLSVVDFHRGYVRLKVAAVNITDSTVVDAAVEVHYNRDMLHLVRIEPPSLVNVGDRVALGNLKPGEKATVAFLLDPQICQGTYINGDLSFYDLEGELLHVHMKQRRVDVVCPVFVTKENINTAMLKRLIREDLPESDQRAFKYPKATKASSMLTMGKRVLGAFDVQLVREFMVKGPPSEAEVWYFGETRLKGHKMVMRLSVLDEESLLEFFTASTSVEHVTGMLAEFKRELLAMVSGLETPDGSEVALKEAVGRQGTKTGRPLLLDGPRGDEDEDGEGT